MVVVGALAGGALVTVERSSTTTTATATSLVNTDADGLPEVAEPMRASAEQEGTATTDDTQGAAAERDADGRTTHATTTPTAAVAHGPLGHETLSVTTTPGGSSDTQATSQAEGGQVNYPDYYYGLSNRMRQNWRKRHLKK
jgi:hypothetical protein